MRENKAWNERPSYQELRKEVQFLLYGASSLLGKRFSEPKCSFFAYYSPATKARVISNWADSKNAVGSHLKFLSNYREKEPQIKGDLFGIYIFYLPIISDASHDKGSFLKIGQVGPTNSMRWRDHYFWKHGVTEAGSTLAKTLALLKMGRGVCEPVLLGKESDLQPNPNFSRRDEVNSVIDVLPPIKNLKSKRAQESFRRWILMHCERYNLIFDYSGCSLIKNSVATRKELMDYLESGLQLYFQPLFEQNVPAKKE